MPLLHWPQHKPQYNMRGITKFYAFGPADDYSDDDDNAEETVEKELIDVSKTN